VRLGSWRQYTYDHVFGPEAQQQDVFAGCVSSLVDSVFEGYNATVLAYGPTGSGKTHTMGMGSALHSMAEHHGIIPRVIKYVLAVGCTRNSSALPVLAPYSSGCCLLEKSSRKGHP
jgi:kinesin family protein 4/21/27